MERTAALQVAGARLIVSGSDGDDLAALEADEQHALVGRERERADGGGEVGVLRMNRQ